MGASRSRIARDGTGARRNAGPGAGSRSRIDVARGIEMGEGRGDPRMLVLLESLRTNLFRLWSDA
jgi:hypothetical protein